MYLTDKKGTKCVKCITSVVAGSHGEEFVIVFVGFYNSLAVVNVRNILYDPYQFHPNY